MRGRLARQHSRCIDPLIVEVAADDADDPGRIAEQVQRLGLSKGRIVILRVSSCRSGRPEWDQVQICGGSLDLDRRSLAQEQQVMRPRRAKAAQSDRCFERLKWAASRDGSRWSSGVVLNLDAGASIRISEWPDAILSFAISGSLPDGQEPPRSIVTVRERWRPTTAETFERAEYEYELVDHERNFRRAFHLHDSEHFVRRFHVVVHEHCERPLRVSRCAHYAGAPIRDGDRGVEVLLGAWTDPEVPDCESLICLEQG